MLFIKKLVILTGGGARGTLMLEKNGFGVWGKLNLFDLRHGKYKFVIISDSGLFVMSIDGSRQSIKFELGEIDFNQIHAAVVSDRVIMYGSNCAAKLSSDTIMAKVKRQAEKTKEQESYITFSGRDKKIEDYFKQIAPPLYNDFAIAEKNYYPAYITVAEGEDQATKSDGRSHLDKIEISIAKEQADVAPKITEVQKTGFYIKKEESEGNVESKKLMPYELEHRYLSLIEAVSTLKTTDDKQEQKTINQIDNPNQPVLSITPPEDLTRLNTAEKPEVIAMARRITLRDYRVEGARPSGRRATYFERSSAQIEKLMAGNERFTAVERLIPGSKFVKINYDQKRYYIVGVIGRDYICYGVPSVYSDVPPEPLCGYARWLPFDADKPHAEGFWMMYQDGVSGETLKS